VRGDDVLGQAVQPVRQLATAGWPLGGEPFIAPPTQQESRCAQRLVERELAYFWAVRDPADPAAVSEALVTGRILDYSVERDVLAHDDLSHFGSPFARSGHSGDACLIRTRAPAITWLSMRRKVVG